MADLAKVTQTTFVFGPNPQHIHLCSKEHTWLCNSPYCTEVAADCPGHGGDIPIRIGREFWKGR